MTAVSHPVLFCQSWMHPLSTPCFFTVRFPAVIAFLM
jgi:hypothetical protein